MDIQNKLTIELKERISYGESITLTRDEFFLLVDGDLGYAKELEENIADLESELEEVRDNCQCDELQEKLNKISKIAES